MKKLLKKMKEAVMLLKENAIPIMSFFVVVLALTPYLREQRGYYAIGGEYILAGLIAYGISSVMHNSKFTIHNEEEEGSESE